MLRLHSLVLSPQQDIYHSFHGSAGVLDEVAETTHELEDGKGYEMLPPWQNMAPASRNSQHLCLFALDGAVDIPPGMGNGAQEATALSNKLCWGRGVIFFQQYCH